MALPDWLEVVPSSGRGDAELTASAPEHTGREPRSCILTGTPDGGDPDTAEVVQEGKDAFVEVSNIPSSDSAFTVPAAGGNLVIEGESNAAALVLDSISDELAIESGTLSVNGVANTFEGLTDTVELQGDPGAAAQYAFRYLISFAEYLGRSYQSWYGKVKDANSTKGSDYFFITRDSAEEYITYQGSLVGITVPANGVLAREFNGESNLMSLSFRRGDSSPWLRALPMEAVLTVTGKDSGEESTVQVTEADTLYSIPGDPGAAEAYAWKLAVTRFPANTGRVTKKGFWNVGDSGVNVAVVMINQPSGGEFCDVETNIPSTYTFPKATQGTLSIKGTSNCTNVWLRGLRTADLQNASMYINGSKANEWEGNNTEPGNIYEFRGEDEAYEWEIRVIFPATTAMETIRTYILGWTNENGTGTRLASFTVNRP